MTCLEIVILTLVIGFVSMMEIVVIMGCVSKLYDTKMKAKMEMTTKVWHLEMDYLDKMFDKWLKEIGDMIKDIAKDK